MNRSWKPVLNINCWKDTHKCTNSYFTQENNKKARLYSTLSFVLHHRLNYKLSFVLVYAGVCDICMHSYAYWRKSWWGHKVQDVQGSLSVWSFIWISSHQKPNVKALDILWRSQKLSYQWHCTLPKMSEDVSDSNQEIKRRKEIEAGNWSSISSIWFIFRSFLLFYPHMESLLCLFPFAGLSVSFFNYYNSWHLAECLHLPPFEVRDEKSSEREGTPSNSPSSREKQPSCY